MYSWRGRPILYSGSPIISFSWAIQPTVRASAKIAVNRLHRNADRALHDARIEVDVRVELARDEVVVLERDLLERHRELEQRVVVQAERVEHLVAGLAHQLGARVVVLVDAVAEAHQLARLSSCPSPA